MSHFQKISAELMSLADNSKAKLLERFFKTGPGQYGEGDKFLGIMVPVSRKIAIKYKEASLADILKLLKSGIHEFRLVGILILVQRFEKTNNENEKKEIFDFYLNNTKYINNWDLVDLSAPKIVGAYLYHFTSKSLRKIILEKLVKSSLIWERRIAILSTFYFIYQNESKETFVLAKKLLKDKHDLIHKAVGWMLREAGKRVSQSELLHFLDNNIQIMPRTTLRYAIERLPEDLRKSYLYCRF